MTRKQNITLQEFLGKKFSKEVKVVKWQWTDEQLKQLSKKQ